MSKDRKDIDSRIMKLVRSQPIDLVTLRAISRERGCIIQKYRKNYDENRMICNSISKNCHNILLSPLLIQEDTVHRVFVRQYGQSCWASILKTSLYTSVLIFIRLKIKQRHQKIVVVAVTLLPITIERVTATLHKFAATWSGRCIASTR